MLDQFSPQYNIIGTTIETKKLEEQDTKLSFYQCTKKDECTR
jgi:hypothetical protein